MLFSNSVKKFLFFFFSFFFYTFTSKESSEDYRTAHSRNVTLKKKSMKTHLIKTIKYRIQSHCYIMYVPPYHGQPQFDEGCHLRRLEQNHGGVPVLVGIDSPALKCQTSPLRDTQCELDNISQQTFKGKHNLR